MRDVDAAAVDLALADSALAAHTGSQIYAGDAPPTGWDPATTAVVLKSRGGTTAYSDILDVSIQAKCYGATAPAAWLTYLLTYDALHETGDGVVAESLAEQVGQQITEPSTGRIYILAYFRMQIRP